MLSGPKNVVACKFSNLAREVFRQKNVCLLILKIRHLGLSLKLHIQLPVAEKVAQLENLTSDNNIVVFTEVAASVSVLLTVVEDVSQNFTVSTSCFM